MGGPPFALKLFLNNSYFLFITENCFSKEKSLVVLGDFVGEVGSLWRKGRT